jgi:hypothetical protein
LTTPGHPFWVARQGWKPAGQLLPGDLLYSAHASVPCVLAETETIVREDLTFNLEVAGFHNYFVSGAGLLVHNASTIGKLWPRDAVRLAVQRLPLMQDLRGSPYLPKATPSLDILEAALKARLKAGIEPDDFARFNVSVWRVSVKGQGEHILTRTNTPRLGHAEEEIRQEIFKELGGIGNVIVREIFTERIPCEGCHAMLTHDVPNAPVFYIVSLGGRTDPRGERLMAAWGKVLKALGE